ncbi:hypothetical protein CFREI_05145 [Corynebacterium freiburgense]|nr:hypothetical protein CFREI_05145 [Corynebacterium freiburgense]
MKKTYRIPAAALATSMALSGLVAVSPEFLPAVSHVSLAQARAQNDDTVPDIYNIQKAPDADKYANEINTYLRVSKARHLYHTASSIQKYDDYVNATRDMRNAADYSEAACYAAKGRVALAILKAEGNEEARKIDISKVGFNPDTTDKATTILGTATEYARKKAFSSDADASDWNLRHKFFNEGYGRIKDINDLLKQGKTDPTEIDAFSIIDWTIRADFIAQAELKVEYTLASLPGIKVYGPTTLEQLNVEAAKTAARETEKALEAEFGPINTAPAPADPTTTQPAPADPGAADSAEKSAEEAKKAAEAAQKAADEAKASADAAKKDAGKAAEVEAAVQKATEAAKKAEEAAARSEAAAKKSEEASKQAEADRMKAEEASKKAEADLKSAQEARTAAEAAQKAAEAAKKAAEDALKKPQSSKPTTDKKEEPKKEEPKRNGFYSFLENILSFSTIGVLLITILKSLGFLG